MSTPHYYFLPCVRLGIANEAALPEEGNRQRRLLDVSLTVESRNRSGDTTEFTANENSGKIQLYGPGDVLGYNHEKLHTRVFPRPNAGNFEANFFPFVEFRAADFLWRFTPDQAAEDTRGLSPWLTLIVLKQKEGEETGEYTLNENTNPDLPNSITLSAGTLLPDLNHISRWAHAQLSSSAELNVESPSFQSALNTSGQSVCRLLCPRRLEPGTKYIAFVVPTFELGRLRGLGENMPDDIIATQLSWELNEQEVLKADMDLPFYHSWEFRTGRRGDFEYLVRLLKPEGVSGLGTRKIDVTNPGYGFNDKTKDTFEIETVDGLESTKALSFESALMSIDTKIDKWGYDKEEERSNEIFQQEIRPLLNRGENKVTPPIYGRWHADLETELLGEESWLDQLNTDPRHRFPASLGVEVIKENQDDFMNLAWQQIGNLQDFNKATEKTKFSTFVLDKLHKRFRNLPSTGLVNITQPISTNIKGVLGQKSIYGDFQESPLPNAFQGSTYRKLINRKGVLRKRQQKAVENNGGNWNDQINSTIERLPGIEADQFPMTILTPEARPDGMIDSTQLVAEENEILEQLNLGFIGSWANSLTLQRLADGDRTQGLVSVHKLGNGNGFAVISKIPGSAVRGYTSGRSHNVLYRSFDSKMKASRRSSKVVVNEREKDLEFREGKSYASERVSGVFQLKNLNETINTSRNKIVLIDVYEGKLGTIQGYIINKRKTPVNKARVSLSGFNKMVRTDLDGKFLLEGIPPGVHKIIVTSGNKKMTQYVRMDEDEDLQLMYTFKPEPTVQKTLSQVLEQGAFERESPAVAVEIPLEELKDNILAKTNPQATILEPAEGLQSNFVNQFGDLLSKQKTNQLSPIMAHPVFGIPMYEYLRDKSQDYILTGLEKVKQNTIVLLQTNRRFIEAYMIGLNHEFAAELAWRDYPTDMRGTFFHQFWDEAENDPLSEQKDIKPIIKWDAKLGTNPSDERDIDSIRGGFNLGKDDEPIENTVLLLRGELLNKYPNTLVYIVPGKTKNGIPTPDFEVEALLPVFDGNLPPDVIFLGFNIPTNKIKNDDYFIVFEERISESRFGLDLETSGDVPDCNGNLSWEDFFPNQEEEEVANGYLNNRIIEGFLEWNNASSAGIAKCTLQRPVRVIVHASRMIP